MKTKFFTCFITMLLLAVTTHVMAEVITIPVTGNIDLSKLEVSHNSMRDVAGQISNFEYNHWIKMEVQTATAGDYELKISIKSLTNKSTSTGSFRVTTSIPEVDVEWAGDADNAGKYDEALVIVSQTSNKWKDYRILLHNVPANQVMTIRLDVVTTPIDAISCGNLTNFQITNANPSYQVTYNLNYTDAPAPTSKKMSYYANSKVLQYPVRSGYKCRGWYTATSGGTKYTSVSSTNKGPLYAQWTSIVKDIPLTFSYSDARVSDESVIGDYYLSLSSGQTAEYEINAKVAGDYVFQFNGGCKYNNGSIVRFTSSNENIVFDWAGDNNTQGEYYENDKVTIVKTSTTTSTFKNYNVVMRNVPVGRFTIKITGLYSTSYICGIGIYNKSASYTLTYDLNDNGTSSDTKDKKYFVENAKIITGSARNGYKFLGWYNQRTGGTQYKDNKTFATADNGTTIYAQWEKLEGGYNPIDGNANIVSNFSFSNGINTAKLGNNTGVFVGGTYDGQTAHNRGVSFAANTPITVKFPESFKNYDGQLYDIFATITSTVSVTKLICQLTGTAPNNYIGLGPDQNDTQMRAMSQHVEIWLAKNGTRVTNVNFVAGCCYMSAKSETLNVYGNSNTLYSNVPKDMLTFSSSGWAPIDDSYNQPFYYFMGNGVSPDHSVELDYTRSEGGCEFMIGYIKYTYTFECAGHTNVNIDIQMNGAPAASRFENWMKDLEWVANVDLLKKDSTVITKGTAITTSVLDSTIAMSDVTFTKAPAAISDISITGELYTDTELTFDTVSTSNFAGTPAVVYSVKQGSGSYSELSGNTYTPTAAGDYTVKAVATYNTEVASKEKAFTIEEAPVHVTFEETGSKADITPYLSQKANVTIARTLYKDGERNTICLPFAVSADSLQSSTFPLYGCTLEEFTSAEIKNPGEVNETLELTMSTASAIEAGKPYSITWTSGEDIVSPVFNGVTITTDEASSSSKVKNVTFVGTLVPKAVEADDKGILFVGTGGALNWPNVGGNINGFRCYFTVDLDAPSSPLRQGMNAILTDGHTIPAEIAEFKIQNSKLQKLIQEGRVVIISNGVRYNLQGQIVK